MSPDRDLTGPAGQEDSSGDRALGELTMPFGRNPPFPSEQRPSGAGDHAPGSWAAHAHRFGPGPEPDQRLRPERVLGLSAALIVHGLFAFWLLLTPAPHAPDPHDSPALETVFVDLYEPVVAPPPAPPAPPQPPVQTLQAPGRPETPAEAAPPDAPPMPPEAVSMPNAEPASPVSTSPPTNPVERTPASTAPALPARALDLTEALTGPLSEWQAMLLRHLHQHLRYPAQARRRHQQGVTLVRFVIDRRGGLRSAMLEDSSGHELLDDEALAVLARAQPLPTPPASVTGTTIEIVIPVSYRLRRS